MKWIPFFKTGKQTDSSGREKIWTDTEIDSSIERYNDLGEQEKKPIVIGHPNDNIPIVGFIDRIKRINDTLYALPGNVADSFKKLVNEGKFPERSISFNADGTVNHFGFLPKGINAAVKNLGTFNFGESENTTFDYSFYDDEIDLLEDDPQDEDILRIEAELEIINKQIEKLTAGKEETIRSDKNRGNQTDRKKQKATNNEFYQKLDNLTGKGKVSPALKGKLIELYNYTAESPAEFEETDSLGSDKLFTEILDLLNDRVEFGEVAVTGKNTNRKSTIELIAETYKI